MGRLLLGYWQGLNTTPFDRIDFRLRPNEEGGAFPNITAALYNEFYNVIMQIPVEPYASPIGFEGWFHVVIPLEDLGGTNMTVKAFQLQDGSGGAQPAYYLDLLRFLGGESGEGCE